ncbi:flagellar M-ring protein FliF [Thermincola ferriacetica]|uniref:Flagellar M-ring protein n=1 Tax=Thermincola ferriacetica TaxID=281456 RepID=A0A0L6W677_9FIRM|nr:flagellar basal-body MS-ring/collar protein FliF [Thermincola ferriacetica]KNZ70888.1 flagellar M-ring protein FliF [Thermincola ferriacetica]
MGEYLLQLKTKIVGLWNNMTRNQKIVIIVSALFLVGTLAVLVRGATRPDYAPLFTQLDPQDAGKTVEWLKENKIPYQLADGGTTILVPSKDVDQTRISLSSEGYPTGGVVGFEAFDQTKFGETDTDRRARFIRALQGELTRTIERFSEVDKARVHIVLPEPSLFLEEQKNATAAVWLQLKPTKTLDENQVKGLVKLVANSVEGLSPENVTVVDMNGNILSESLDFSKEAQQQKLSMTQLEIQKTFQADLQRSLQSMLEKVVGIGKVVCRVRAELDFDQIQKKTENYGDKHVLSEQKTEQSSSSSNTATPQNTPGTAGNIPGYVATGGNSNSQSSSSDVIRNYVHDKEETVQTVAPGSVKRLSVSVMIDKAINQQQQKAIEEAVVNAAGINKARGDQVSVIGMPFNTEYQQEMAREMAQADRKQTIILFGSLGAVLLLIIVAVILRVRMLKKEQLEELGEIATTPLPLKAMEEIIEIEEKELTPEEKEKIRIKEQVEKVAGENPADVAQLLKTWLAEE